MLDKKSLYVIYLFHKANKLCLEYGCSNSSDYPISLDLFHLQSNMERIGYNLDRFSILNLLNDLGSFIDPLPLSKEIKAEFPRTIRQFNYAYKLWLSKIRLNPAHDNEYALAKE